MQFFFDHLFFSLTRVEGGYVLSYDEGEELLSFEQHEEFQEAYHAYINCVFGEKFKAMKSGLMKLSKEVTVTNTMGRVFDRKLVVTVPPLLEEPVRKAVKEHLAKFPYVEVVGLKFLEEGLQEGFAKLSL